MCGIAGVLGPATDRLGLEADVRSMIVAISHRGPDDHGIWVDDAATVGLGHRRLAIIDPTPEGHQPMHSASGRYVITFNGEIYNYRALRKELAGYPYRGNCDTEVMLAAFERWGLREALGRFAGMFAFALWDRQERTLFLARDRLGIKPLYYGVVGQSLLFGSELKALRAHSRWAGPIDRGAVALFLRHNYIPAPYSIYTNVKKLPPGTLLDVPTASAPDPPIPERYWDAGTFAAGPSRALDPGETIDRLHDLLRLAVGEHMESDVPLGAFLSGGIDSSLVVALMQSVSSRPVKTFTIGFHERNHDESAHARSVAERLGTEHTELYVSPQDALEVIPALPTMYDEPFADSSQVPTFLICRLVRRHVTVALSGDGGDELFGGYPRYATARQLWRLFGWAPPALRRAAGAALQAVRFGPRSAARRARTLGTLLARPTREELYRHLVSHWKEPAVLVPGTHEPPTALTDPARLPALGDFESTMMFLDLVSYLPDDILVKVDRASMAVSLEARVPILDHRVVEFALGLPREMKLRGSEGKWLLRRVLYRYLPRETFERPKQGFGVPIDSWLRGPLRDWAEALLDERQLREGGFFDPTAIRSTWLSYLRGDDPSHFRLWTVLQFQAWLDAQRAIRPVAIG